MRAILLALTLLAAPSAALAGPAEDIEAVLKDQQAAWNGGDIDAFMTGYWNSEDLRFASGGDVTTGWAETLARYHARYDTPEKMGRLEFTDLDIDMLGEDAATAFGRWTVVRDGDDPTGLFTLIFRRIDGEWVIVHDHTSAAD